MVRHEVTDDTRMPLFAAEGLIRALLHGRDTVAAVHYEYLRRLDTQDHAGPPPAGDDPVRTGRLRDTDIAGDFAEVLVTRRLPADRAVRYP